MKKRRLSLQIGAFTLLAMASAFSYQIKKNIGARGPSSESCSRFPLGSVLQQPKDLFSQNGTLTVSLSYHTSTDPSGNPLFCYLLADGEQSPTLHLKPGDKLVLTLTNDLPTPSGSDSMRMQITPSLACADSAMNESSVNLHYHGANISPTCHQDEVLHTLINSGQSFTYEVTFPKDEPPGLYWYHPHVHGISESAVLGGASGALVVDGIQNVQPEVAGLPEQILVLRDNLVPGNPTPGGLVPSWDLSLNYIPVPYPSYPPAIIPIKTGEKQLWRVVNAAADSILDLELLYDGVPEPLRVVALDGTATGSQNSETRGTAITMTHVPLSPGARSEFVVTGPAASVKKATLVTQKIDTGPDGDNDPTRVIAEIDTLARLPAPLFKLPLPTATPTGSRFKGLVNETPLRTRQLNFSEVLSNPNDPDSPTNFYITEAGNSPKLFAMTDAPQISVTQGTTEDWVISNQAKENHVFHIHQIHFLLLEQNGVAVPEDQQQFLDTIQIPYWSGTGPYPSVKVRMDFRGPVVGDFVYHCHILQHEDAGMMAIVRVLPRAKN